MLAPLEADQWTLGLAYYISWLGKAQPPSEEESSKLINFAAQTF